MIDRQTDEKTGVTQKSHVKVVFCLSSCSCLDSPLSQLIMFILSLHQPPTFMPHVCACIHVHTTDMRENTNIYSPKMDLSVYYLLQFQPLSSQ